MSSDGVVYAVGIGAEGWGRPMRLDLGRRTVAFLAPGGSAGDIAANSKQVVVEMRNPAADSPPAGPPHSLWLLDGDRLVPFAHETRGRAHSVALGPDDAIAWIDWPNEPAGERDHIVMTWDPAGGPRELFRGAGLRDICSLDDGTVAVLSRKGMDPPATACSLIFVSSHGVQERSLVDLGRDHYPRSLWKAGANHVTVASVLDHPDSVGGPDDHHVYDSRGTIVTGFQRDGRFYEIARSPDGRFSLTGQHGPHKRTVLAVLDTESDGSLQFIGVAPATIRHRAVWLRARAASDGVAGERALVDLETARIRLVESPPTRSRPESPPAIGIPLGGSSGIRLAKESIDRLFEYGGTMVVALRRSPDLDACARALEAATGDLYRLDTPTDEEGGHELPSWVSEVRRADRAVYVLIDANDTERELLTRIPMIVAAHLRNAGVTDAEIWLGTEPPT